MLLISWRETVVRSTECIGTIFHLGHTNNLMGLWSLMPLSTIFQLYRGGHFIGGGNRSTQTKTLDLLLLTNFAT